MNSRSSIKPLIGIGCDIVPSPRGEGRELMYAYGTYLEALESVGATAVILTPSADASERILPILDGVLLLGGDDLDPASYGETDVACDEILDARRQAHDLALASACRSRGIPTLGICLGAQLINVAAGGSLVQDIPSEVPGALTHSGRTGTRQRHELSIEPGSRLAAILGGSQVDVNSGHHQSVKEPGEGLAIVARSADGVIEAVEDPAHPFYVGVQWHPEEMLAEESAQRLFRAFADAAVAFRRTRKS